MASRLSPSSIPNLPIPASNFPKHLHRISLFSLPPPLDLHANSSFSSTTISRSKGRSSPPAQVRAVQESPSSEHTRDSKTPPSSSSKLVLVIGGNGGVGQLVVASLLDRNIKSRLLLRDPRKATTLFGVHDEETL